MHTVYWRFVSASLRIFFRLLYGPFAWAYDGVAAGVSLGRWRTWVQTALPVLEGPAVLELGHGPGHLLTALRRRGIHAIGLDGSRQMGRIAFTNQREKYITPLLVNGYAQFIPFLSQVFNQVVATFPAEYFWDPRTLREIHRVLKPGGTLLVVPAAWITRSSPLRRAASWLFRLTGQAPAKMEGPFLTDLLQRVSAAGFRTAHEFITLQDSTVLHIIARKRP